MNYVLLQQLVNEDKKEITLSELVAIKAFHFNKFVEPSGPSLRRTSKAEARYRQQYSSWMLSFGKLWANWNSSMNSLLPFKAN